MQATQARAALGRLACRRARLNRGILPCVRPVAASHRNSSFIKQVMEQVKKDMEADEKLKKDYDAAQKSAQKVRERVDRHGENLNDLGESLKSASSKTSELLSDWKQKIANTQGKVSSRFHETSEQSESLKKAREFMREHGGSMSASSQAVLDKTKDAFAGVMDTTSKAFSYFGDEHKRNARLKEWKAHRDIAAEAAEAAEKAKADDEAKREAAEADAAARNETKGAPEQPADALVVSKAHTSSWDRFGAGLRDMPFLSSVFENPLFDRMFGESEIAASIREMKDIDYSFQLEEFAEDIEYVVAPHIIRTYLEGDQQALERHCGEAAFAAVNASIKARKQQKLTLDTNILAGPKEVELKGAKLMDKGPPCFIWTFNMQQVNCLRDKQGDIIEGAVDDIRTVCYAMVVQRHPNLDELALEYPWQISELAILWNQPCF